MSNHRTNRYPESCSNCKEHVEANQGTLAGPPWKVFCQSCLPFPRVAPAVVALRMAPSGRVLVEPQGHLGGAFRTYREAISGLSRTRKTDAGFVTTCAVEVAAELAARIGDAPGLRVDLGDDVRAAVGALEARNKAELDRAEERLAEVDASLAERGGALYGYQRTGVPWLASRDAALLADEMGLGKTLQALLAAPAGDPILVVCPAVAKGVWVREAARWRPDLKAVALKGRKSFRWPEPGEMVVINYDILPDRLLAPNEGTVLIADEAHALKNPKAKRTRRFRALSEFAQCAGGRTWLLTATPLLNKPPELWSLLKAAGLTDAYGSWTQFCRMFNGVRDQYGYSWGEPTPEAAARLERVQLRRLKQDVLQDLPAKRYQQVGVNNLDATTLRLCDAAEGLLTDGEVSLVLHDSVEFETMSAARAALSKAKIPHLLELVGQYEEAGEPLVVFSAHRAPVEALADRPGWAVITGSTSPEERSRIEDEFQAGRLHGVAGTVQAAGVAITLTAASTAVFVDRLFTPALNHQAEDRIHRIGQDRGVLIIDLVAEHALDERLYDILTDKQSIIDASVNQALRATDYRTMELSTAVSMIASQPDEEDTTEEYERTLELLLNEMEQMEEKKRERTWQSLVRQRCQNRGIRLGRPGKRRAARGPRERWAREALLTLTALDGDRANYKNSAGFSKADTMLGHKMATRAANDGLTPAEWRLAVAMCRKYHRQVGECP